jgi:hypothetical protein
MNAGLGGDDREILQNVIAVTSSCVFHRQMLFDGHTAKLRWGWGTMHL